MVSAPNPNVGIDDERVSVLTVADATTSGSVAPNVRLV